MYLQMCVYKYTCTYIYIYIYRYIFMFVCIVVLLLTCIWFFVIPWTEAHQAPLSSTICQNLLKFMSIESVVLSKRPHPQLPSYPLPTIFPRIRVFSNESALHIRRRNYWSFSISPSNEYSGLISFRIDWFDLFAAQGTLKSLLQNHSLKVLILQCSALFMVQLSHLYITTEKTIVVTIQTFVIRVMSLLFNTLCLSWLSFQGASIS